MDWKCPATIRASRISLRAMSECDVDCIYAIFSDPEVMRYWTIAPLRDRSDALRVLAESRVAFRRRESIDWGIVRQDNDILIGTVTLFAIDLNHLRAEIGFALARAYWRNGYMREALHAAIAYAFGELHLRRIEADVDPRNLACVQLLRRLGFQNEGHLLERWLVNGTPQDSLLFGLLKSRWNGGGGV